MRRNFAQHPRRLHSTQKLYFIAQELPGDRFAVAKNRIDITFDEVEEELLREFDDSYDDIEEMTTLAHTLYPFKRYQTCVDSFISTFIQKEHPSDSNDVFRAVVVTCHKVGLPVVCGEKREEPDTALKPLPLLLLFPLCAGQAGH